MATPRHKVGSRQRTGTSDDVKPTSGMPKSVSIRGIGRSFSRSNSTLSSLSPRVSTMNSDFGSVKDSFLLGLGRFDTKTLDEQLLALGSGAMVQGEWGQGSENEPGEDSADSADSGAKVSNRQGNLRVDGSSIRARGARQTTPPLPSEGTGAAAATAAAAAAAAAVTEGEEDPGKSMSSSSSTLERTSSNVKTPLEQLSIARMSSGGDDTDSDSEGDALWSVIKVRSEADVIKSLDPRFFEEDYDPVKALLTELPLLARSQDGDSGANRPAGGSGSTDATGEAIGMDSDEFLELQLRDMDVARVAVTRQIASTVRNSHSALIGGMRQVQAVDLDIARAGVQVSNGRRRLQRAMTHMTSPVLHINRLDLRRRRMEEVRAQVNAAMEALSSEGKIEEDLDAARFTDAVARAELLEKLIVSDEQLSRLGMLRGVRDRTSGILGTMRERVKGAIGALCQTFSPERYGGIIRAYLLLEDRGALRPPSEESARGSWGAGRHGEGHKDRPQWISQGLAECSLPLPKSLLVSGRLGAPGSDEAGQQEGGVKKNEGIEENAPDGMEMLADDMLAAFKEEFERRLLDTIHEASRMDEDDDVRLVRHNSRRAHETTAQPLRIPAPQLFQGVVQVCHGTADLLHTYFCCVQWHASAFDERHEDDAFLHTQTPRPRDGKDGASTAPKREGNGVKSANDRDPGAPKGKRLSGIFSRLSFSSTGQEKSSSPEPEQSEGDSGDEEVMRDAGDARVGTLHKLLDRRRRVLWETMSSKIITLLSESSVGGGTLALEDLCAIVGAMGLLACLGDEFVRGAVDDDDPLSSSELKSDASDGDGPAETGEGEQPRKTGARAEDDDGGRALRECLSAKAKEFFLGVNKEGVTVLRQMLEMEAWQRVPVPSQSETDGVGGLLDATAQRFCSPRRVFGGIRAPYLHLMHGIMSLDPTDDELQRGLRELGAVAWLAMPQTYAVDGGQGVRGQEAGMNTGEMGAERETTQETGDAPSRCDEDMDYSESLHQPLLRAWHQHGNPFRVVGESSSSSSLREKSADEEGGKGQEGSEEEKLGVEGGLAGLGLGRLPPGTDVDDDPDHAEAAVESGDSVGVRGGLGKTAGAGDLQRLLETEQKRYGSGWVVTQAALNGVTRYAGHALQIMALVRPAAPSAFEGLQQLVDLYLYCVFTLFCPQWAIDALFGFGDEESIPSPEEMEKMAALKAFASRVSYRLNNGSPTAGWATAESSQGNAEWVAFSTPARSRDGKDRASGGTGASGASKRRHISRSATSGVEDSWIDPLGLAGAIGGVSVTGASSLNRGSVDSSPSASSPSGGALGAPGGGSSGGARDGHDMGDLWPFRVVGNGDSPSRSRGSSAHQGLFSRRSDSTRHPTPRPIVPLPSCLVPVQPSKSSDALGLEGLLPTAEGLWGGSYHGGGGPGAGGSHPPDHAQERNVDKTVEWKSLGERAVATESCMFIVQVLKAAHRRISGLRLLPASKRADVDAYVSEVEQVAAQIRFFVYRIQGHGLAGGSQIATFVEAQYWTIRHFQNDANPYVEAIIKRCRGIREGIYRVHEPPGAQATSAREAPSPAAPAESPSGPTESATPVAGALAGTGSASGATGLPSPPGRKGVPARARGPVWTGVLEATLLALLRGFSRVKRCSTEGRALMSMDLQALALGLEDSSTVHATKGHVHAYVNAFYFGEEDLVKWMTERWRSYQMYQLISLLKCGDGSATGVFRKLRVKDLVAKVERLYLTLESPDMSGPLSSTLAVGVPALNDVSPPRGAGESSGDTISPLGGPEGVASASASVSASASASASAPTAAATAATAAGVAAASAAAAASSAAFSSGGASSHEDSRSLSESSSSGRGPPRSTSDEGVEQGRHGGDKVSDAAGASAPVTPRRMIMRKAGKFFPSMSPRRPQTGLWGAGASATGAGGHRAQASPDVNLDASSSSSSGGVSGTEKSAAKGSGSMRERMTLLRSSSAMSPPRIPLIANPFRRTVDRINGSRSGDSASVTPRGVVPGVVVSSVQTEDGRALSPEPGGE